MADPKPDPVKCDVLGCGTLARRCTDGTEVDVQGLGRPALANLNLCENHPNWAHSNDARVFALSDVYRNRK